jgi:hypothetical protein
MDEFNRSVEKLAGVDRTPEDNPIDTAQIIDGLRLGDGRVDPARREPIGNPIGDASRRA